MIRKNSAVKTKQNYSVYSKESSQAQPSYQSQKVSENESQYSESAKVNFFMAAKKNKAKAEAPKSPRAQNEIQTYGNYFVKFGLRGNQSPLGKGAQSPTPQKVYSMLGSQPIPKGRVSIRSEMLKEQMKIGGQSKMSVNSKSNFGSSERTLFNYEIAADLKYVPKKDIDSLDLFKKITVRSTIR